MSILQEIHTWSQTLPLWQQDAIARLYANRTLKPSDYDDLYALAKAEAGIPDPEKRMPKVLAAAQVATPPIPTRLVQLLSIKQISNINALAEDGALPIAPLGLTVIYGENGAGKSGYSRVLKRACRARDQSEPILPNARLDPKHTGRASAVFETLIDGQPTDLPWQDGKTAPEPLSEISIFDTHCARAYIDNQGDFAYVPYGLDILAGLVTVCNELKERAAREKSDNTPNGAAYAPLSQMPTEVGQALLDIPRKTKASDIEELSKLTEADLERLDTLNRALAESDPKKKAQYMRQKAIRIDNLIGRIRSALGIVSEYKIHELQTLVNASNAAKQAAEIAAKDFKETPGHLPGTGGEEWKLLFEAARSFSAISHGNNNFPDLPPEALCPLCQNELGHSGVAHLQRFDDFIQQAAEKAARGAREKAASAFLVIKQASLNLGIDESLGQELTEIDEALSRACICLQPSLEKRQQDTLKASAGQIEWNDVEAIPTDPTDDLLKVVHTLNESAKALEESMDEKAKAAMVAEQSELESRRRLREIKPAVLDAISRYELCAKLQKCIDGMATAGISRKSTALSKTMATQELAEVLNVELKKLKVHDLQVSMRPESPGGRTKFKLMLQLPGGGTPSAILSEGEQRAIAIASFLAEVKLSKGQGGVVFDDPVSSLDHRRRWEVAERLANEALQRQVIVLTHDIYFLCIMEQKARDVGAHLIKQYIRRTSAGYGVHSNVLPFDTLTTKDRIGRLRQMLVDVEKSHKSGDEDDHRRLTHGAYRLLRMAWERSIEEVLFNGSIQRFGEGVSTQRLKSVVVEDGDYKKIEGGMTKCSKFEHDPASTIHLPVPDPDELREDIEKLEAWRKEVEKRKNIVAANR
ncbi:AAA family ATPase [Billgrantia antri]|uniref:AAA family ATPase n=1 Tax=Halomonas sulfidivorans TaxID=2733488 RepID=A0ABX7WFE5_9GAMM|nr:AAA family ATPase [Halomonas sulfidivorans]QTP58242.1 AAA family ATPase [Halomonas sulfidivorans]